MTDLLILGILVIIAFVACIIYYKKVKSNKQKVSNFVGGIHGQKRLKGVRPWE